MARGAASVSVTIGVAFATLLVTGGILVGPAILECAKAPGSVGSCFRGKIVEAGVLPAAPAARTSALEAPVPMTLPPRPIGAMDANATEYVPVVTGAVTLSPPIQSLDTAVAAPSEAPLAVAALVQPAGTLAAIDTQAPAGDPPSTELLAPMGALEAGVDAASSAAPTEIALAPPAGVLAVTGTMTAVSVPPLADLMALSGSLAVDGTQPGPSPLTAAAAPAPVATPLPDPAPVAPGAVLITGSIGAASGQTASLALEAALTVRPPPIAVAVPPVIETAPPPHPPVTAPPPAKPPAAPKPPPAKSKATSVPKVDKRYPDVVLLPLPPAGGSSFVTLQLR